jgi:RNA polymerase sigma-70 factor (ECF subfamily)
MSDTNPAPQYQPGSDEDFNRLYRESHSRILRTLVAVLGDVGAAEDCAQDAFVKAYKAWPRWKPDAPAEAWLHRIAIRVAISHRRRERLRETGSMILHLGRAQTDDPAEEIGAQDLLAALRRLPTDQAAAVVLRHHHGYSNREIAAALGAPESTVAARLAAAKRKLRDDLGVPPSVLEEVDAAPISGASR